MKKFLILFVFVVFLAQGVEAKTIKVISLKPFSTEFPSPIFKVKTVRRETLVKGVTLEAGTIISGIVLRVSPPKRGKRDSCFEFIPTEIVYKDNVYKLGNLNIVAIVMGYNPIDKKELAFAVARKTANYFLRGAVSAVQFAQGAMEAEDGQRIQAGAQKVYKDSFLVFIEPGEELYINRGDIILLKIKKDYLTN